MKYDFEGGPFDGESMEIQPTAFETSREGREGIQVRRGVEYGPDEEPQEPAVGFYEHPVDDAPEGTLFWSGWL